MVPTINYVLFYLSTFLMTNASIVCEQSRVTIDLESKEAQIEYRDLKVAKNMLELAEKDLDNEFNVPPGLEIRAKTFESVGSKLNATVSLGYKDEKTLFNYLGLHESDGVIRLAILPYEKLKNSNGTYHEDKEKSISWVQWGSDVSKIEIFLKRSKEGKERISNFVRLSK